MDNKPWYRTALRWAQTNLVEIDPSRYDAQWWREHWRRTRIQGVIVNAGGIVAYYPTEVPLHRRAVALEDKDLYGLVVKAAREEGLAVIARMDSNRVAEEFYRAHPDWIAINAEGVPYRQGDKYVTCINSPYYTEYLPQIMREVIARSSPDGFADNSWAGLGRDKICHCQHCQEQFHSQTGLALPLRQDWDNEAYRQWIRWGYSRRTEQWDFNNDVTMKAGGEHCRWMGMVSGEMLNNSNRFIDLRAIMARSEIVMLDHQRRSHVDGFEQNTESGKRLHELAGWDKMIPESTPQYQLGEPAFRLSSMPVAEVRLWSSAGFAGGIQPWWHHIGSLHEDRRQYKTAEPIFTWHEANQDVLFDRQPIADVGVIWSQDNNDFYGRSNGEERAMNPYRGALWSLDRAGLTYLPVHADDIAGNAARFRVLLLPNLAAMSDAQVAAVKAYVEAGGSVIATSETSLYDAGGDRRADFALGDVFGIHAEKGAHGRQDDIEGSLEFSERHTYLRLSPELRAGVYGPADATAPQVGGTRHQVLAGFEETDTLPFGGYLPNVRVAEGAEVLATFIPDFPIYPPETAWMRTPRTDHAAIVVRTHASGGKLVWLLADLDRCFARDRQFEHAMIIANAVKWAIGTRPQLTVTGGGGFVVPSLYQQGAKFILHLNNSVVTVPVPGRQNQLLPVGPVAVELQVPEAQGGAPKITLRVAGRRVEGRLADGKLSFTVDQVADHEVCVIDWS